MKELNLQKILNEFDVEYRSESEREYYESRVKEAMKKACFEAIELASENALTDLGPYEGIYIVDKESILKTKDQIK